MAAAVGSFLKKKYHATIKATPKNKTTCSKPWIYVVKGGLDATITAQNRATIVVAQYDVYTCPATCFNANSYSFLGLLQNSGLITSFNAQGCICDTITIKSALATTNAAYGATSGILVGLWLMYMYGNVLVYYMTTIMSIAAKEQDVYDRLAVPSSISSTK